MNTRCYIAGAGEFVGYALPGQDDYIIAADAGYKELVKRGFTPDIVVGDFDSLGEPPDHPNVLRSPVEKDDTDMMIAVNQGFLRGCKSFMINGGLGGRLDHTLANIQILVYIIERGARGVLLGRDMSVIALMDSSVLFSSGVSGRISIFCASDQAEGVTLTGLKYPLDNATLTRGYPLGVSNEFTGAQATISVRAGTLIIMYENLEG